MASPRSAVHEQFPSLRVDVEPEREVVRVVPIGELDMGTVGQLAEKVTELRDAGFKCVVLDLRRLEFMDSTGLHLILEADAHARTNGHDFTVIPGPPVIQRLFELSGVGGHLRFCDH
jgi:anti-anti-sigma factor